MKLSVLSSGSKGNSVYVETNNHKILIDVGNTCLYIEESLRELGVDPNEIDMILITHAHKDHIGGLKVFAKKYNSVVYTTEKILKEAKIDIDNKKYFDSPFQLDSLNIIPVHTSHDVTDSYGYILEEENESLVYMTDTGYINKKYFDILKNRTVYIFESNHDVNLLMNNTKYPYHIRIRILSDKGHLSNEASANYLNNFIGPNTKKIILAHLSEENNTSELAYNTLKETINSNVDIMIAEQNKKTELMTL